MLRQKINDNWLLSDGSVTIVEMFQQEDGQKNFVDLPHDAMIHEKRRKDTKNGHQTGFYPGNVYTYTKQLFVPADWQGRSIALEFEGVAGCPKIYINGDYAGGCFYSYTCFTVEIEGFLRFGEKNEIKVVANNIEQASRWYSGGGIYRSVNLLSGGAVRLAADGVRITTQSLPGRHAVVQAQARILNSGMARRSLLLETAFFDKSGKQVSSNTIPVTVYPGEETMTHQRITVADPLLWDAENPDLYTCEARLLDRQTGEAVDQDKVVFGIRTLALSAQTGLLVNGRETKLRGTCVHHDNGIIGAAEFPHAEERKCRLLKEAGFNCIRFSHQPVGKSLLEACDRVGMYVIDELSDMWTRPKNPNDYAMFFPEHWERDVEAMVQKDYNHPCVIMYSTGNEIQEAGTARGAHMNRRIHNLFKKLDPSRYTTSGINGMMAGGDQMGEIVGQAMQEAMGPAGKQPAAMQTGCAGDEALERGKAGRAAAGDEALEDGNTSGAAAGQMAAAQRGQQAGADEVNGMMSVMMGPVADAIATSSILRDKMEEFITATDIAGYNYLTALHEAERELHPDRVVLGMETFPADIARLWEIVKDNHHVIGDMTWTGYDYLGEAGCGIFHYDGTQNFSAHWPDRLAYIGDIDLAGYRRPISYLREIVYGLRKTPYIGVLRMNRNGQTSSRTPWMWKDNIASWTWRGYEGEEAAVDVYADAQEVELYLNGRLLGRKKVEGYAAAFTTAYEPGTLTAVGYRDGAETGRFDLETAGEAVTLSMEADRKKLTADGEDLVYLTVSLKDAAGRDNLQAKKQVRITVEGPGRLQGMGSADPQSENSYDCDEWETYDGYLLAAVRAGKEAGIITITARTQDGLEQKIDIPCEKTVQEGLI